MSDLISEVEKCKKNYGHIDCRNSFDLIRVLGTSMGDEYLNLLCMLTNESKKDLEKIINHEFTNQVHPQIHLNQLQAGLRYLSRTQGEINWSNILDTLKQLKQHDVLRDLLKEKNKHLWEELAQMQDQTLYETSHNMPQDNIYRPVCTERVVTNLDGTLAHRELQSNVVATTCNLQTNSTNIKRIVAFLTYSLDAEEAAADVVKKFEAANINCITPSYLKELFGESWPIRMYNAYHEADYIIPIISLKYIYNIGCKNLLPLEIANKFATNEDKDEDLEDLISTRNVYNVCYDNFVSEKCLNWNIRPLYLPEVSLKRCLKLPTILQGPVKIGNIENLIKRLKSNKRDVRSA